MYQSIKKENNENYDSDIFTVSIYYNYWQPALN